MYLIYDNLTIKSIDNESIAHGTSANELIYRATHQFCAWISNQISQEEPILILCGNGNNGADGYCIGEHLAAHGYSVIIASVSYSKSRSAENHHFLRKVLENDAIKHLYLSDLNQLINLEGAVSVVIDALVGNGTNRPLDGLLYEIVTYVNRTYDKVYAVDSPTGLLSHESKTDFALFCSGTFSFQFPKQSFFAAEHEKYVGDWQFGDIGLSQELIKKRPTDTYLIRKKDVAQLIQKRPSFAHKGMMGRALQIIGNVHMKGAGIMAALACTKMGAGHTFTFGMKQNDTSLSEYHPDLIQAKSIDDKFLSSINALAIGPGLGQSTEANELVDELLINEQQAMILDADTLNIIAHKDWIKRIPQNSIITPHIKEFQRLFGATDSHHNRIERQRAKAKEHKIYIILKGRYTSIATPDGDIYYNRSGNPSLAKAGSGDVLTGMLLGLRAQGYPPLAACLLATYIHGHAADLWIKDHNELSMSPMDLITYIDLALKEMKR